MKKVGGLACACLSSLVFGLFPAITYALGLGDIHLHSYLNEPLSADIALDDVKGIEASDIIIMVADQTAFEKAGLQPTGWLNHIRFQVTKNKNGKMKISLTTLEPIQDPFADLLLQVTWPGGKMVREYTLLLDPPKAATSGAKVALSKATALMNTSSSYADDNSFAPTVKQQTRVSGNVNSGAGTIQFGGQYGPVYDETLWRIASRLVGNSGLSVHQAVMAIAYKNQQAFSNGNINLIKKGAILSLPTQAEIKNYSQEKAKNFVDSQPSNWQEPTTQASQKIIKKQQEQRVDENADSKPLKLVAPIGGEADKTASKETQPQQVDSQRITLIEEAIDTLKRSNEDISKKNQSLQSQNELLVNQLAMKEAEINRLKQSTGQESSSPDLNKSHELLIKTPQQSHDYAIATPDTGPHHNETLPQPSLGINTDNTTSQQITKSENKPEAKREVIKPIAKPTKDQNLLNEKHSQGNNRNIISIVFLLALISSIFGWLWFSRHRIYVFLEWLKSHSNKKNDSKPQRTDTVVGSKTQDSQVNYGLQFDLDKALNAIVGEEKKYAKPQGTFTAFNVEDQDNLHKKSVASLEDAEIYIAYERYQQAEKILQEILGHGNTLDPIYWEALLKCLELYVLTEKYDEYEKLYSSVPTDLKDIPPKVWSKIVLLQEKVQADKAIHLKSKSPQITTEENDLALASHHFSDKADTDIPSLAEQSPAKVIPVKPTGKLELVKDDDIQSQISLAKAYIEVGDIEAAKDLLTKSQHNGTDEQKEQIKQLLSQLNPK